MRNWFEIGANWLAERWRLLIIPPVLLLGGAVFYLELTNNDPLRDRQYRMRKFDDLVAEMKDLEMPPSTAINSSDQQQKSASILIKTQYRTELDRAEFHRQIEQSLFRRGWKPYDGEQDKRIAIRNFSYCRDTQDATLYLRSKSLLNSDTADYWELSSGERGNLLAAGVRG